MRKILFLALLASAFLLFPTSTRVTGCTDWDEDWVCANVDCNDFNPTINYDGDADGDGFTVCSGDCMDDDPTVHKCANSHQQYPVQYNPPEQPCHSGYNLHTSYYHCANGGCDTDPFYETDEPFLRDCFPLY